ncbi:isoprenylcysteine carboxyl methyltransferase family protein [Phenylobacterium immobile]|uniref:isoprenylcysteine carboxyl methyltransferase family protein n=1 Tax=Phenylobacterium immobile TaxID=21 RepID=UPI000AE9F374|nr:isoprenylcysteine carboxylmethyltransferase family protein [Phenylobacterium immobile]
MTLSIAVLAFVTLQRLAELWLARRNTRRLMARGAVEVGAAHYPAIVGLHAAWLIGLWLLTWDKPVSLAWLIVFAALQLARVWVIASLGERWTTRIIILPGAPNVRRGPYQFIPHPNYLVVAAEIAVLPIAFDQWLFAVVFSIMNALVLRHRIRAEDAAMAIDP